MKQAEAVIKALEMLGGRGSLKYITLIALNLPDVDWSKAKEPEANIRRIVRNCPDSICPVGKGEYALVNYITETDELRTINEQQKLEIEEMKKVETASQFIDRFTSQISIMLKHDTKALDEIRKLFHSMKFDEYAERLDALIELSSSGIIINAQTVELIKTQVAAGGINIEEIKHLEHLYNKQYGNERN